MYPNAPWRHCDWILLRRCQEFFWTQDHSEICTHSYEVHPELFLRHLHFVCCHWSDRLLSDLFLSIYNPLCWSSPWADWTLPQPPLGGCFCVQIWEVACRGKVCSCADLRDKWHYHEEPARHSHSPGHPIVPNSRLRPGLPAFRKDSLPQYCHLTEGPASYMNGIADQRVHSFVLYARCR